jgi:hypothetical protein
MSLALAPTLCLTGAEEVVDRTVAVVGDRAITLSEVKEQLALEALDRGESVDVNPERYREVTQRLIRLRLVQREMSLAGFIGATDADVQRQWEAMKQGFDGETAFQQALAGRGLTQETVREFLRQQLDFEGFVDFRFRTGLVIPRGEIETYYEKEYKPSLPALMRPPPLEQVYSELEADLIDRRVDPLLEDWISRVRSQTRITIVDTPLTHAGAATP